MPFRFTQREPRDAKELFQWLRELLPDLEVRVLENCEVKTTETAIAHGLGCVPAFIYCDTPHCIAIVRQKRKADSKHVYLYATNLCVVDVLVVKAAQLSQIMGAIKNGGYHYPDWDPIGTALGDHKVSVDQADEDAAGYDYLGVKLTTEANVNESVVTVGGKKAVKFGVAISPETPLTSVDGGDPGDTSSGAKPASFTHRHPKEHADPTTDGARLYTAGIAPPSAQNALALLAPLYRWADADVFGFGTYTLWDRPPYYSEWHMISAGVWRKSTTGYMGTGYTDGETPFVGMRIAIPFDFQTPGNDGNAAVGIYVVDNVGSDTEYAQITRASDANNTTEWVNGKILNVTGGATWSGHTFVYIGPTMPTLETTVLQFEDHGTSSIFKTVENATFGFGTVWTVASGICTWSKNGEGVDGVPQPPAKTRILADAGIPGAEVTASARYLVQDGSPYDGLYEVQTYGTYEQVIRRVVEANEPSELTGLVVHITGTDVWEEGAYFHQTATITTIDVSATSWTITPDNPLTPTQELLTNSQLTTEGASSDTYTATKSISTGIPAVVFTAPGPTTLVGTPNLSKLPAGRETCQVKIRVKDWNRVANPGAVSISMLLVNTTSDTSLFDAPCGVPLTPDWQTLNWQYDLAADVTMSPTDRVALNIVATSTCASSVEVEVEYNSASRLTWVQLAGVQFSLAGTDDHQLLKNRANVNNHYGVGTATTADGIIPTPTKNSMVIAVSGSTTIRGMGTAGLESGVPIDLTFLQACSIVGGATGLGTDVAPFLLGAFDIDWTQPTPTAGGSFGCRYYATELPQSPCFKLTWGPNP